MAASIQKSGGNMLNYVNEEELEREDYPFEYGGESNLYRLKDSLEVYKKYISLSDSTVQNKTEKLIYLDKNKDKIPSAITPTKIIVNSKYLPTGYTMKYSKNCDLENFMMSNEHSHNEKLDMLKKLREILFTYASNGIFYFDCNIANFLCSKESNQSKIDIIDIDNIEIDNADAKITSDCYNNDMTKYLKNGGQKGNDMLTYAFNHLTRMCFNTIPELEYKINPLSRTSYSACTLGTFCYTLDQASVDTIADHEFLLDYLTDIPKKI